VGQWIHNRVPSLPHESGKSVRLALRVWTWMIRVNGFGFQTITWVNSELLTLFGFVSDLPSTHSLIEHYRLHLQFLSTCSTFFSSSSSMSTSFTATVKRSPTLPNPIIGYNEVIIQVPLIRDSHQGFPPIIPLFSLKKVGVWGIRNVCTWGTPRFANSEHFQKLESTRRALLLWPLLTYASE